MLRERENGRVMPDGRIRLPRARFGRPVRGFECGEEGDAVDIECSEGGPGDMAS